MIVKTVSKTTNKWSHNVSNISTTTERLIIEKTLTLEQPTCARALVGHVPNQSTTHLLNRAGEVAQRPSNPSLAGFIVKTT